MPERTPRKSREQRVKSTGERTARRNAGALCSLLFALCSLFPAVGAPPLFAQSRPSVRPTRVQRPPVIDGRLDDEAWRGAAHVTKFVQRRPLDGAPGSEETEVFLAYDADRLYFGIVAHYSDPSLIRANRVDRQRHHRRGSEGGRTRRR